MKLFVIIALLMLSTPAKAGLHIGVSYLDKRLGNAEFTTLKTSEPSLSYNIGYYKELPNEWIIDGTFSSSVKSDTRAVYSFSNNRTLVSESRTDSASLLIGKRFNNIVPSLIASYVKVDEKLLNSKNDPFYLKKDSRRSVVWGANINYLFIVEDEKFSTSLYVLLPNTKLDLRRSYGIGLNYYF